MMMMMMTTMMMTMMMTSENHDLFISLRESHPFQLFFISEPYQYFPCNSKSMLEASWHFHVR